MIGAFLELTLAVAAAIEAAAQLAIGSVAFAVLFGATSIAFAVVGAREYDRAVNR